MARRKKKVSQPGFWAMVVRGWRKFKAFLGAEFYYCPHDWGRFCPKCRLWAARQIFNRAGLQWVVEARKGQSVQPFIDALKAAMRTEDVEVFKALEGDVVETEAEGVSLPRAPEDTAQSEPQPRPQTEEEEEVCPACSNVKIVGGLCPMCGHQTGDEVPYDMPEAAEDPEDVEDLEDVE